MRDITSSTTADSGGTARDSSGGRTAFALSPVLPAYQQVANQLRDLILSGVLASGDKLPSEAELTGIFSVSRSTVREALKVLASRDLIHTLRGTTGGTFVARVQLGQVSDYLETSLGLMSSADDVSVAEMLEARELLEVPAARLAATRCQPHHITALREALAHEARDRQAQGRARQTKFQEHRNFHGLVVAAAGNGLLGVMTEPVFRVLQARFLKPDLSPAFWSEVDHDHDDILACIESGDGDAAANAMQEHLIRLRVAYHDGSSGIQRVDRQPPFGRT